MRCVALCWELGGGQGHLATLAPLARFFAAEGWRVYFIGRDLWSAGGWFSPEVRLVQAPLRHGAALQFTSTPTFAHILHNVGYGEAAGLQALADGWRSLFELIRPDLVVADHSPTALLAARGLAIPAVVYGPGFGCPPDQSPLPDLQPWWPSNDPAEWPAVEARVCGHMNRVLARWHAPPLERLTRLYHDAAARFLTTFAELDHFPGRTGERYWGYSPFRPGAPAAWPAGAGPRIFAYLTRFPQLPRLLAALARRKLPTLVCVEGGSADLRRSLASASLHFIEGLADLADVGRGCAAAITHGNFGATTALLLSGVPVLCIPRHLEQALVARAVHRLGAGEILPPESITDDVPALNRFLSDEAPRRAAHAFAAKYRDFDPDQQCLCIESRLRALPGTP